MSTGQAPNRRLMQMHEDGALLLFFDRQDAEVGRLEVVDGHLHFEGHADESAAVFLAAVVDMFNRGGAHP